MKFSYLAEKNRKSHGQSHSPERSTVIVELPYNSFTLFWVDHLPRAFNTVGQKILQSRLRLVFGNGVSMKMQISSTSRLACSAARRHLALSVKFAGPQRTEKKAHFDFNTKLSRIET